MLRLEHDKRLIGPIDVISVIEILAGLVPRGGDEVVIKEIRYEKYRFYFITDGRILKFGTEDEFAKLLIKFVRMSEKKDQQQIINEIKAILRSMGFNAL
ncbi:MAG: hypothetical protein ABIJ21_00870 [Nanoarchaeota archaeon]